MPKTISPKARVLAEWRADIDIGRFAAALLTFALHRLRATNENSAGPPMPAPAAEAPEVQP